MSVNVFFYSYYKELTGCAQTGEELAAGSTVDALFEKLALRFPRLASLRKSTLIAVGLEYQDGEYELREGDQVSLFPPVQGG